MNWELISEFFKNYINDLTTTPWGIIAIILILAYIYRKKSWPYSEVIYSKQFDGYCEIIEWLNSVNLYFKLYAEEFEIFAQGLQDIPVQQKKLHEETENIIKSVLGEDFSYKKLIILRGVSLGLKWEGILPSKMANALADFSNALPKEKPTTKKEWKETENSLRKYVDEIYKTAKEHFRFSSTGNLFGIIAALLDHTNGVKED
ncbi:hypothetical protein KAW48_10420 [candidate division WOR-3 bacterium]|nr:hypothetical protein [candidate division WOR-3 bacterium]